MEQLIDFLFWLFDPIIAVFEHITGRKLYPFWEPVDKE